MSSEALVEGPQGVVAAWETSGQIRFARIAPGSRKVTSPISAPGVGQNRKHPALAMNGKGESRGGEFDAHVRASVVGDAAPGAGIEGEGEEEPAFGGLNVGEVALPDRADPVWAPWPASFRRRDERAGCLLAHRSGYMTMTTFQLPRFWRGLR